LATNGHDEYQIRSAFITVANRVRIIRSTVVHQNISASSSSHGRQRAPMSLHPVTAVKGVTENRPRNAGADAGRRTAHAFFTQMRVVPFGISPGNSSSDARRAHGKDFILRRIRLAVVNVVPGVGRKYHRAVADSDACRVLSRIGELISRPPSNGAGLRVIETYAIGTSNFTAPQGPTLGDASARFFSSNETSFNDGASAGRDIRMSNDRNCSLVCVGTLLQAVHGCRIAGRERAGTSSAKRKCVRWPPSALKYCQIFADRAGCPGSPAA